MNLSVLMVSFLVYHLPCDFARREYNKIMEMVYVSEKGDATNPEHWELRIDGGRLLFLGMGGAMRRGKKVLT